MTLISADQALNAAAAALLPRLPPVLVRGLADGDDDQDPPEVVAVGQVGEAPARHAVAEGVEGAEGHILFIGGGGPGLERANRTRDWKYRCQSWRAASGSPARRASTQIVTEPRSSAFMAPSRVAGRSGRPSPAIPRPARGGGSPTSSLEEIYRILARRSSRRAYLVPKEA